MARARRMYSALHGLRKLGGQLIGIFIHVVERRVFAELAVQPYLRAPEIQENPFAEQTQQEQIQSHGVGSAEAVEEQRPEVQVVDVEVEQFATQQAEESRVKIVPGLDPLIGSIAEGFVAHRIVDGVRCRCSSERR